MRGTGFRRSHTAFRCRSQASPICHTVKIRRDTTAKPTVHLPRRVFGRTATLRVSPPLQLDYL